MNYYALVYDVVEDFVARRAPYRTEHLELARAAHRRGELLLAGALGAPPDGALLVFRAADQATAEDFARRDPYVTRGLVTRWRSLDSLRAFAGDDLDRAVVAADALPLLMRYDRRVRHYELVLEDSP